MHRKYLAIVGAAIAVIFGSILISNEDKSLDTYLLGGFIVAEVIIFVTDQIIQNRRHLQDRRERHTKDLYEVYKRITDVGIKKVEQNLELDFPVNYKEFRSNLDIIESMKKNYDPSLHRTTIPYFHLYQEYEYFEFAMEHLQYKKYNNIYKHWEKLNQLVEEYNKNPKFIDTLEQRIQETLSREFSDFEEREDYRYPDHFYSIRTITKYVSEIFYYYKEHKPENMLQDLIIDTFGSTPHHCICTGGGSRSPQLGSIDRNKVNLDQYRTTLIQILNDGKLQTIQQKEILKYREILGKIDEFSKELEILIKKLKAGELIEGKCPIGY